ncbi:MAG: hypothetical protein ASARMPREDX12_005726 [Alectoria sarmentosa]|nr:MAG: hypothetical protein ASARMPREDX12_005726 [Alectoria sarmentosa]
MNMGIRQGDGYIQTWHYDDEPAKISVVRKQVSHGPGFSREHEIVELHNSTGQRRDPSSRERSHSNRPANTERRDIVLADKGRRSRDSSYSSSDSDSDTDGSSPRRIRSRKHYNKDLVTRAGPNNANSPDHSRSIRAPRSRSRGPRRPSRRYDSDSDSSLSDDNGGKKPQPKPPPKEILYTGLACVATIAAANNIYQSAKAHHTRQKELEEGEITSAEAQKKKMQARKMDLISLGIAAVGAYNVRNGWRRAEGHWKAHREMQAEGKR